MERNSQNWGLKQNHKIVGITNCEITKCGDPQYLIQGDSYQEQLGWNQRISVWLSLLQNITQIITFMYCLPHLFYKILTLIRYSQNTRIFMQNMFMLKLWYRHNISKGSSRIWLLTYVMWGRPLIWPTGPTS